jgi:hypothetical protein
MIAAGLHDAQASQQLLPYTGMAVVCQDGMAGYVERSIPTWQADRPTHIVVRMGDRGQHSLIVPVRWAEQVTADHVTLKVRKRHLHRLARYQVADHGAAI